MLLVSRSVGLVYLRPTLLSRLSPSFLAGFYDGLKEGLAILAGRVPGLADAPAPADADPDDVPDASCLEMEAVDKGLFPSVRVARMYTGGLSATGAAAIREIWASKGFPPLAGADAQQTILAGNVLCIARDLGWLLDDALVPLWPASSPPPARRVTS